ncbi:NAD(P)-dependent oxidoreductase [Mesorhizobium sp.]|uniref:NAD(P)-dependent oxidoreductase n=1 Tax=Mesorhizobium sp. TaxID=1871066 RepID=UPI002601249A|nr:NAD(P)-dependent oxidoreductase [Mesorhizobium sp.]
MDDVKHLAPGADAIIGLSVPDGLFDYTEKLKVFSWMHSGCDDLRLMGAFERFKQRGVKLANIRGSNAVAVAEHAMMFVLALAKKTLFKHTQMNEGRLVFPNYAETQSSMLQGRTLCVIGLGNIGGRIARHAKAFDMHVLGVRRRSGEPVENVDAVYGVDDLLDIFPRCDYIIVAAPNTKETNNLIGKDELAAMKKTAFLVNVSRSGLIQEKPLYDALTSGGLAGFAADVWWQYGFGHTFPASGLGSRLGVHKLPNVLTSNDQAANAEDVLQRNIEWGTENLVEFFAGKPMQREVNLELGY